MSEAKEIEEINGKYKSKIGKMSEVKDIEGIKDKDEGMEKGHAPSVSRMFNLIEKNTSLFNSSFK